MNNQHEEQLLETYRKLNDDKQDAIRHMLKLLSDVARNFAYLYAVDGKQHSIVAEVQRIIGLNGDIVYYESI